MNPDRIRAAIRMLYPDEMTPTARNVLERILDDETPEAPAKAWCDECKDGYNGTRIAVKNWKYLHNELHHKPELA